MKSRFSALPWVALVVFTASRAVAAPPAADGMDFFEKQVRPVLVNRCYQCHSVAKKTKGGLALDSRDSTLKGGDSGPALVAGDPEQSKLIEAVRYKNHDLQMPPKGELPAEEVKTLEEWIKMGAPDPRAGPALAAVAATKGARVINIEEGRKFWSFTPIARVEPPAVPERASAIKTPIDAFIQAKLKEKGLLAAPPADKRTLIRRATFDLIGLPPTPKEVDAFLADQSPEAFDKVIERLLASPQYGERWGRHWLDVARYADSNGMDENIAFGNAWRYRDYVVKAFNNDKPFDQFLIEQMAGDLLPPSEEAITATGFLSLGARVLAEPDIRKLQMDIIDEQIDTTGKAFLGMTFGCARCHDHKFDPIKTDDYYAMAAIFRSTRSLSDEKMGAIKFWNEHSLATPEQVAEKKKYDEAVKARHAEVAAFTAKARNDLKAELQSRAADYLAAAAMLPEDEASADVERLANTWDLRPQYLRACRQYLDRVPDLPFFAAWREFAEEDASGVREHYEPLIAEALKTKKGAAYDALADPKGFLAVLDLPADALDATTLAKIAAMNEAVMDFENKGPELPAIMSVADDKIVKTLPVHLRGSYLTLGKPVERGFPEVLRTSFATPIFPAKQSGRLELARWMASSENPLTARVLVNRVWRWHFGQGIVSSTDNFGLLGSRPSHPELLDWLATTFIESGWSIKDLHRVIMKSAVYQESSAAKYSMADGPDPRVVDPENRLLWRANIQRLEAEEIRDAMLSVSGWLDLQMGGKTIPLRNREFVFNHTSKDHTTYESARRALYLPIVRNNLYNMLEQFDYPDPTMPTGSRNSTVIAPQALIMMNSPVVMECGARLAARLASLANDEQRVQEIYALLYDRAPSEREKERVLAAIREFSRGGKPESGWSLMCQTLLAANEFIYLR
jgi:Protein of unknown function (DUF1549)/Protein of unknown function (DUF1553)/Planctomycete cytochrome C